MQDYDNADLGMSIILLIVIAGCVAAVLGVDLEKLGILAVGVSAIAGIARGKSNGG